MRASRRISHTDATPTGSFLPIQITQKRESGCGFFVWYDVKLASMKEKHDLVQTIELLRTRICELEKENA
ncbi:hypothetical protein LINPERPRIM_LOCUS12953 [Linum perenne]